MSKNGSSCRALSSHWLCHRYCATDSAVSHGQLLTNFRQAGVSKVSPDGSLEQQVVSPYKTSRNVHCQQMHLLAVLVVVVTMIVPTEKPVAGHFNSPGHSLDDLRIAVLEVMTSFDVSLRRRRESYWIKQLRSLHPEGMNLDV